MLLLSDNDDLRQRLEAEASERKKETAKQMDNAKSESALSCASTSKISGRLSSD